MGNLAEGVDEGGGAGLLDTGFEEIDWLEKGSGEGTGAETGNEVKGWGTVSIISSLPRLIGLTR